MKTCADLQTKLARRLGSNVAPTDAAELSKRRDWFWEAINTVCSDEFMWFMKRFTAGIAVDDQYTYPIPTRFRHPIQIKVDNIVYTKTTKEHFDEEHADSRKLISIPNVNLLYEYYLYDDVIYFSPILTAPTPITVTIVSSGTTATVTTASTHGYLPGQYVTIDGANETEYNGTFLIESVTSTTSFTYILTSTTSSPATGTITATLNNIEIWYYEEATEPTTDAMGIVIPDKYDYIPVAYAEGRYWSSAHKRGKAADGFTEFEGGIVQIKKENFRRKYGQEE